MNHTRNHPDVTLYLDTTPTGRYLTVWSHGEPHRQLVVLDQGDLDWLIECELSERLADLVPNG